MQRAESSVPGASSRSKSPPTLIHLNDLVTPTTGALSTSRFPSRRLIRADLPTFGKPMTHALTGRDCNPRAFRLSLMALLRDCAALLTCTGLTSYVIMTLNRTVHVNMVSLHLQACRCRQLCMALMPKSSTGFSCALDECTSCWRNMARCYHSARLLVQSAFQALCVHNQGVS